MSGRGKVSPRILIIAGPNGAGKTTFSDQFLVREADCPNFINADLIARGMRNFEQVYCKLVDSWVLYDNSGTMPELIRSGAKR